MLMVVCCRYGMPFDANGSVSMLMNVTFDAKKKTNKIKTKKTLNERDKGVNEYRFLKMNLFLS